MKIKKICITIFTIIFIVSLLPLKVKADDELSVVCKTSANNTYPGEIIDVLVYLDNYNSQSIKDITTMQLLFNLKGDYYSYVENSLTDLSNAEAYEQMYFLNYINSKNQIQLQFSDLTNILDRNTRDLYKFKVKINDNIPIGSKFDIGPDTAICADGRQAQIYKITTMITKSEINVVDQSVADENTELNTSVTGSGQNGNDTENAQNEIDNSNDAKDNSVSNGNTLSDSNKTDANSSNVKDNDTTENNTQPVNSLNTSTNTINQNNKSNKVFITVIVIVSIIVIGFLILFLRKTKNRRKKN